MLGSRQSKLPKLKGEAKWPQVVVLLQVAKLAVFLTTNTGTTSFGELPVHIYTFFPLFHFHACVLDSSCV
jgi:hypothetical protein